MACPTCDHTMHHMECSVSELSMFWCPRCGTLKLCDEEILVPLLVKRCRKFAWESLVPPYIDAWIRHGIAESISEQDTEEDE